MEKIKYYSANEYFRNRFGCKVYKIALDGGFSCPNRDGKIGTGGCIFCSAGGSGDFAGDRNKSIEEQLSDGKKIIEGKLPKHEEVKYLAYFQAFTNTYAPVNVLKEKYMAAINDSSVAALSIATRPDCLPSEVISLLAEMNRIKPVFIELGLQTSKESTAEYIRRGYELFVYDDAVLRLKENGLEVITHVILGLPGETKEDMLNTVRHVVASKAGGIKLQLLHVLRGTDLEKDYLEGKFETLSFEEYIDIVVDCIRLLPSDMVVHRLTGDGDKKTLVAPLWSTDKKRVLNGILRRLQASGTGTGSLPENWQGTCPRAGSPVPEAQTKTVGEKRSEY